MKRTGLQQSKGVHDEAKRYLEQIRTARRWVGVCLKRRQRKKDDDDPEAKVSKSHLPDWLTNFHRDLMAREVMGDVVHTIMAPIEMAKFLSRRATWPFLAADGRQGDGRLHRPDGQGRRHHVSLERQWQQRPSLLPFRRSQFFPQVFVAKNGFDLPLD
ncbi:unnamed protein product [Malus baccata var. baccata]